MDKTSQPLAQDRSVQLKDTVKDTVRACVLCPEDGGAEACGRQHHEKHTHT